MIPTKQYAWAENVMTRGGIPQTRPGMGYVASFLGNLLQGMCFFQPTNSLPTMVIAVDGYLYYAFAPYNAFTRIKGIKFSATAPIVNFCSCIQSVVNNPDGSLTLISPVNILIAQDGVSRAAYWNGSGGGHIDPTSPNNGTPIGLWMEWTASRLWVAQGNSVFAGDICNPLSFTETVYLDETSNFQLPGPCTGLKQTTDMAGLFAFTAQTVTAFQSSIRVRSEWQTTPGFQTLLVPNVGCVAGRSIVNQYGIIYWMSQRGAIGMDSALASKHTSVLTTIDGQMTRSKRKLSADLSRICATAYENLYLVSVPSGASGNAHTWILDQSPIGDAASGGTGAAWTGIWSGFQPVSWAVLPDGSACYCATQDQNSFDGTQIHIWRAFDPQRQDNLGGSIACQFETAQAAFPVKMRFAFAEIDLCEIRGNVSLQVYWGGSKGPWIQILDAQLQAEDGCFGSAAMPRITKTSTITAFQPQCRTLKTVDFSPQGQAPYLEGPDIPGVDKCHGLLFQWTGRMGIRKVTIWATQETQAQVGATAPSEAGRHNILAQDGSAIPL